MKSVTGTLPARRAPVLVIGAGPAGLAVSRCLQKLRVDADLVDAHGMVGGAYSRMYPLITLSSPAAYLGLPDAPVRAEAPYLSAAEYQAYLQSYAHDHSLTVEKRRVVRIGGAAGEFSVELADVPACVAYKAVVVATGMCDHPVNPEIIGLPNPPVRGSHPEILHAQDWQGPSELPGERVLIVGGGMRAVEIAEECADSGLQAIMSVRNGLTRPLPRNLFGLDPRFLAFPILHRLPLPVVRPQCVGGWRFRGIDHGFNRHVSAGSIVIKPQIARMNGRSVLFADCSSALIDAVVFATGYRYDTPFLPKEIPRSAQGYPLVEQGECKGWPGLFVIGVPCALRADSHFIHGIAADAPLIARQVSQRVERTGRSLR